MTAGSACRVGVALPALLVCAVGAVLADPPRPSFATKFSSNIVEEIESDGSKFQVVGTVYADYERNMTRFDASFNHSLLTQFQDLSANKVYQVTFDEEFEPTCHSGPADFPVAGPTEMKSSSYFGIREIGHRICNTWYTVTPQNTVFYFFFDVNSNTPVGLQLSSMTLNYTVVYTSFSSGIPKPEMFDLPSLCNK